MNRVWTAFVAVFLFVLPASAWAQGTPQQCGATTAGHLSMYVGNNSCLSDAGGPTSANGTPPNSANAGTRPSGVGIVNSGQGIALYSGYSSAAYSRFLAGFDGSGNALLTVSGVGGNVPSCNWSINGVTSPCIGSEVVGPYVSGTTLGWTTGGDNTAALTATMARTDSPIVVIPAGTYDLACGSTFTAASAVSIYGAGRGVTTIKLDSNCSLGMDAGIGLLFWNGKAGASMRDLTIDLNGATAAGSTNQNIVFYKNGTFDFRRVEIKGASAPHILELVAVADTGHTVADYRIQDNLLSFPVGSTTQNQCIATTTIGGTGTLTRGIVTGNICVNSGMQLDGDHTLIADNDISGWAFGTGIFVPPVGTDTFNLITGNNLHDSALTHDSNSVPAGGIENDGNKNSVIGNHCVNLGGACVINFGQYTLISSNDALDVAKVTSPVHASCEDAGFVTPSNGVDAYGSYTTYIGNKARNSASSTAMKYAYCESGSLGLAVGVKLIGNDFVGATTAYSYNTTVNPPQADWVLLYRQPGVSNVATVDFTGLDTASYHFWKLQCNGIGPQAAATMQLQIGEGAGPTWETSSNYGYTGAKSLVGGGGIVQFNSAAAAGILFGDNQWVASTQNTITIEVGDLGAADTKAFRFSASGIANGSGLQDVRGSGNWGGDSNPITGLRLMANGQNISINNGCLLWGHP